MKYGTISGKVTIKETNASLKDVKIEVLKDGNIKASAITNNDGTYLISNLIPDTYSVKAIVNKDIVRTRYVPVNPNQTTIVDFSFNQYIYKIYSRNVYKESRRGRNYTFYFSPEPGYEIYKWSYYVYESRNGWDNGSYISNNCLVIKIRLDGKWYWKAKYGAVYTYAKKG